MLITIYSTKQINLNFFLGQLAISRYARAKNALITSATELSDLLKEWQVQKYEVGKLLCKIYRIV